MNTIRTKIYALHAELSEALFSASKAQESSEKLTDAAKDLELKQRELMKKIGNKENDLDQVQWNLDILQWSPLSYITIDYISWPA